MSHLEGLFDAEVGRRVEEGAVLPERVVQGREFVVAGGHLCAEMCAHEFFVLAQGGAQVGEDDALRRQCRVKLGIDQAVVLDHQRASTVNFCQVGIERPRQVASGGDGIEGFARTEGVILQLETGEPRAPPGFFVIGRPRRSFKDLPCGIPYLLQPVWLGEACAYLLGCDRKREGVEAKGFRCHNMFSTEACPVYRFPSLPTYPILPSIWSWIRRFISTAYSMGSSFTSGSMNPPTIMLAASPSLMPRLVR